MFLSEIACGGCNGRYVRAKKRMQLYVLGKSDLDAVLKRFPAVEQILAASMTKRSSAGPAANANATIDQEVAFCIYNDEFWI